MPVSTELFGSKHQESEWDGDSEFSRVETASLAKKILFSGSRAFRAAGWSQQGRHSDWTNTVSPLLVGFLYS